MQFKVRLGNLNYRKLEADVDLFEDTKEVIAAQLAKITGVNQDSITVAVMVDPLPESVNVDAKIPSPSADDVPRSMTKLMAKASMTELLASLAAQPRFDP